MLLTPKGTPLTRITLRFALSGPESQSDLLREFAMHDGVEVRSGSAGGLPVIEVDTFDTVTTAWDVRATVGMFDDAATEIGAQE